jgi:Peptidase inhibitor I78 family
MNHSPRWLAAFTLATLLAACAAPPPPPAPAPPPAPVAIAPPPPPAPVPECHADGAKFAIGKIVTPALEAAARERSDAQLSRILKPKQMVTMEFDANRLNLVVDGHNKVTAVRCG